MPQTTKSEVAVADGCALSATLLSGKNLGKWSAATTQTAAIDPRPISLFLFSERLSIVEEDALSEVVCGLYTVDCQAAKNEVAAAGGGARSATTLGGEICAAIDQLQSDSSDRLQLLGQSFLF